MSFIFSGFVVVRETNAPLSGLRVVLFDVDPVSENAGSRPSPAEPFPSPEDFIPGQRLGSVLTDATGSFRFDFETREFEPGDPSKRPDLLVYVLAPEDTDPRSRIPASMSRRVLHFSVERTRDAGRSEAVLIRLPQALVAPLGLAPAYPAAPDAAGTAMVGHARAAALARAEDSARHLREQVRAVAPLREAAVHAFRDFSASRFPVAFRASPFYARGPGEAQTKLVAAALASIAEQREVAAPRYLRKRLPAAMLRAAGLEVLPDGGLRGDLSVPAAIGDVLPRQGGDLYRTAPLINACLDRSRASALLDGLPNPPGADPVSPPGAPPATPTAEMTIAERVSALLATATTPEENLRYLPADPLATTRAQIEFAAPKGAADVTAYFDFQSLQIAFEPIWSELFSGRIEDLGQRLYRDWNRLTGGTSVDGTVAPRNPSDLGSLINEYRRMTETVDEVDPPPPFLDELMRGTAVVTPELWRALTAEQRDAVRAAVQTVWQRNSPLNSDNAIASRRTIGAILAEAQRRLDASGAGYSGLSRLADDLERALAQPYRFDVFAGVNLGVMATYRQAWEPLGYQAGRLVSTLPLAPKETRRFAAKQVTRTSGMRKETREQMSDSKSESSQTDRTEAAIVKRARDRTSFENQSRVQGGIEGTIEASTQSTFSIEAETSSENSKRNFREAVMRSAYEYRQTTKVELESSTSLESSTESTIEVTNPNDEITVTYLIYELERQFAISEELHKVTPVVLVAYDVPRPDHITKSWLIAHAWILRKVLLDPSLEKVLEHLHSEHAGEAATLAHLRESMERQLDLLEATTAQLRMKTRTSEDSFAALRTAMLRLSDEGSTSDVLGDVAKALAFGPLGLLIGQGGDDGGARREEVAKLTLERADKETQEATGRVSREVLALKEATQAYVEAAKRQINMEVETARLITHVQQNILSYMQAIWDHEPPDQRYFRIYDLDVPWIESPTALPRGYRFPAGPWTTNLDGESYPIELEYPLPSSPTVTTRKLFQVADLDRPLGYKGNYAIFRAKQVNYMHLYMMQPYFSEDGGGVTDPDPVSRYSTQELLAYLACVRRHAPEAVAAETARVRDLLERKLSRGYPERETVSIPTGSTFVEALPGKHPILEDFKRVHRALDVKKVQADVRAQELENLRLASRLFAAQLEDPQIDRKIVVTGHDGLIVPTDA